tara:strand:- start:26241 stop:27896 length:1656 start_codon:yes stop_codon:yes gene_type:complete
MATYRLINGSVIDPTQKLNGQQIDICIDGEKIVDKVNSKDKGSIIDCTDMVILAGGIDMHTHIGGGKTNIARLLLPENHRDDKRKFNEVEITSTGCCSPGTLQTGYKYAEMGYTAAFEPAMIFSNARQAHMEMGDVPILDHGAYVMLGNDEIFLEMLAKKSEHEFVRDYVGWAINNSKALGVKVVNPGGVSAFKFNQRSLDVDEKHSHWELTPRNILKELAISLTELGVPHPLHIHTSNLGVPGNIESTIKTIEALDGLPGHLTHVQFHCYGSEGSKKFSSGALALLEMLKKNPNISIDVGQIIFGQTVTTSADTMKQFSNSRNATPKKWVLGDIECDAGCGVVPFKYREESFVNSLQWVIGLELFLLMDDPWRIVLTTDHPNGGPFTSYPHLIRLLMDKSFRDEQMSKLHPEVLEHCSLHQIKKELSLYEIVIMTRSAPAKLLGLKNVGNLRAGSVADISIYKNDNDKEYMFSNPEYVFKNGKIVVRKGKLVSVVDSGVHTLDVPFDKGIERYLKKYYETNLSTHFSSSKISVDDLRFSVGSGRILTNYL